MNKHMIRKYARLAVRKGVNVQKGQEVVIYISVDQADFGKYLADEAYRAGAKRVWFEWSYQAETLLKYRNESARTLSEVPAWVEAKQQHYVDRLPCQIHVLSDDPDGLKAVNATKLQKVRFARMSVLKKYRDAMDNKYQWTIVAVPSKAWAKKIFPKETPSAAVEKLWKAIFEAVRLEPDNDPMAAWDQHNADFASRADFLNSHRFDYITYKSSNGTDFKCELIPEGVWCGGGETSLKGIYFNPNMPTEEVFTSPKAGKCSGRLVATKPLSYMGALIDGFYIDFVDGKAVNWDAKQGKEQLTALITSDETSGMLGELALVPQDSPISNQGILYYNTLFDENASCHVALGRGFSGCIEGYENRSAEEIHALGVNDSQIHVDFMIGAPDMQITGYKDGVATPIFVDGNWAF